jgi:hypothetical protein
MRLKPIILMLLGLLCPLATLAYLHPGTYIQGPILTPSSAFAGADCSLGSAATCAPDAVDATLHGSSGYQLLPTASFDEPPYMWIEPGCAGQCTGLNYLIGVVAGNADRAQIDHVRFCMEDLDCAHAVTVNSPSYNPRTKDWSWSVNVQSGNVDGDAILIADVVPTNGRVRRTVDMTKMSKFGNRIQRRTDPAQCDFV